MTPSNLLAAALGAQEFLPLAIAAVVVGAVAAVGLARSGGTAERAKILRSAEVLSAHQVATRAAGAPLVCEIPGAAAPGSDGLLTARFRVSAASGTAYGSANAGSGSKAPRSACYDPVLGLSGIRYLPIREELSGAPFPVTDHASRALVYPQEITADFIYPAGVPTEGISMPKTVFRHEPMQRNQLVDLAASVVAPSFAERVIGHLDASPGACRCSCSVRPVPTGAWSRCSSRPTDRSCSASRPQGGRPRWPGAPRGRTTARSPSASLSPR